MKVSATEAKNHLGQVLEQARSAPVFIEKAGRLHSVVISAERYEALLRTETGGSMAERRRRFNEKYKDWIDEQNRRFEAHGTWNDEFRRW